MLPLITASSAQRNYPEFKALLTAAKSNRIPFKKIYEALLQNYLFTGYPSALVSLKLLKEFYPSKKIKATADMNLYNFRLRGEANCRKVYSSKFEKLIKNIKNFSPDLADWLVLEGYGKVLGRKGLTFGEREMCVVAVLTVMKFEDQLYSHINGAVKAGNSISKICGLMEALSTLEGKNNFSFGKRILKEYEREKGMR